MGKGPFNIYSFWGIVWVHVVTGSLTVKVILLTPAFRNMNASFEEASRVAGASTLRTALRITVPVMAPVILSVLLLGTMVSLQTFEVEQVLGLPFRFFVFSTMIYDLLVTRVPRYDAATALAVLVLAAMLPLVLVQQWLTRGRRYTTVTGQFQNQPHALGRLARGPPWPSCSALVLVVLGVPVVFALLGTFMKLFGFFNIARALDARQLEDRPRPTSSSCARSATRSCSPSAPRWRPSSCTRSSPTSRCARATPAGGCSTSSRGCPSRCRGSSWAWRSCGSSSACRSCGRSTAPPRS